VNQKILELKESITQLKSKQEEDNNKKAKEWNKEISNL